MYNNDEECEEQRRRRAGGGTLHDINKKWIFGGDQSVVFAPATVNVLLLKGALLTHLPPPATTLLLSHSL